MAIITIYKCDKCGAEQSTADQFWKLSVQYEHLGTSICVSGTDGINVCRKCLESLGIYASPETKESPEYSPPTIEELISEIIYRELNTR